MGRNDRHSANKSWGVQTAVHCARHQIECCVAQGGGIVGRSCPEVQEQGDADAVATAQSRSPSPPRPEKMAKTPVAPGEKVSREFKADKI